MKSVCWIHLRPFLRLLVPFALWRVETTHPSGWTHLKPSFAQIFKIPLLRGRLSLPELSLALALSTWHSDSSWASFIFSPKQTEASHTIVLVALLTTGHDSLPYPSLQTSRLPGTVGSQILVG